MYDYMSYNRWYASSSLFCSCFFLTNYDREDAYKHFSESKRLEFLMVGRIKFVQNTYVKPDSVAKCWSSSNAYLETIFVYPVILGIFWECML